MMPALIQQHTAILGPLIDPFERSLTKTFDLEDLKRKGEAHNDEFGYAIHNGVENGLPMSPNLQLTIQERDDYRIIEGGKCLEKCYLWVIDSISVKIMWEKTPNVLRGESIPTKPYVCHTNITGCQKAFIGGEMYFCEDGNIYMNFASDRYGRPETEEKKLMVVEAMKHMKYKNINLLKDYF